MYIVAAWAVFTHHPVHFSHRTTTTLERETRVRREQKTHHTYNCQVVVDLYCSPVYWGVESTTAPRCTAEKCALFRPAVLFTFIADIADDELFGKAMRLSNHVLHALIPPQCSASQRYNLRHRTHSLYYSCHHTPHACQMPASLHECCTKTNIRHITLELLNHCMCFTYCALLACVLTCR